MNKIGNYFMNLLLAIDHLVNALCGGYYWETISSRVGKRRDGNERFWAKVIDKLFFWDRDHTTKSIEKDRP